MTGGVVFNSPYAKPQPGVAGWGVGAQGAGMNPTAVGNAGGLVNMFTGAVNNPFSDPVLGKNTPTTNVDPYVHGGVFGPGPVGPQYPADPSLYNKPLAPFDFTKAGVGAAAAPPAAPDAPNPLDALLALALHPGGGTGTVRSSYDLKGALGDIAGVYNPQLSALDSLIAQKKGNATDNSAKLKALYASLVSDTQAAGTQGDQHYTDLMGKQTAATQAERDAITQRYNQQLADMQKQMTDSGFANLIPVRTQKLQDQMNHELANINTQGDIAQNQSTGLQGSQHNWYGESANVNRGQGVNAQAANLRQLQDALNQITQQRAGILSNEAQAQLSAKNANRASISAAQSASNKAAAPNLNLALQIIKLRQDQANAKTKAAADAKQTQIDNLIKIAGLGKGVKSATTGQSTFDPSIASTLQQQIAALG